MKSGKAFIHSPFYGIRAVRSPALLPLSRFFLSPMANPNVHINIPNDTDSTTSLLAINIFSHRNIKLNSTNYLSWKLQFHAMFVGYNLDS